MDEMGRLFQDNERGAASGTFVYKSMADTTIWGEE